MEQFYAYSHRKSMHKDLAREREAFEERQAAHAGDRGEEGVGLGAGGDVALGAVVAGAGLALLVQQVALGLADLAVEQGVELREQVALMDEPPLQA